MTAEDVPDPLLGRVLDGRYRLDAPLGGGGFGAIYEGYHLKLKRAVAVKLLHPEHVRDPELRARFEREAQALAALSHPNIVPVFDYGVDGDLPFLVMEKLEGRPLAVAIARELPIGHAIGVAIDVASALSYVHAQGIVHRDLKPANIFLQAQNDGTEATRVLDFGLAKILDQAPEGLADAELAGVNAQASTLMGTPAYMSPEQCRGEAVDARADVYSLALVLYESVVGEEPFQGTAVELIHHQIKTPLPLVAARYPDAPWARALDVVLQKASAKDRDARFANGAELHEALLALASELPPGLVPSVRRNDGTDGPPSGKRSSPIATAPTLAAEPDAVGARRSRLVPVLGIVALLALSAGGALLALGTSVDGPSGLARGDASVSPDASAPGDAGVDASADASAPSDAASEREDDAGLGGGALVVPTPSDATLDPWAPGVPRALRRYAERTSVQALSRRDRASLARWIRAHPSDVRGPLAYGHALMSQGARTEALGRYRDALQLDEHARFDRRLRTNLLRIAAYDGSPREGADLAADTWGRDLVEDIDVFLATLDPTTADGRRAAQRLRALRARVSR